MTVSTVTKTNCTPTFIARYQNSGKTVELWYITSLGASPGTKTTATLSGAPGTSTVGNSLIYVEEYDTAFSGVDATSAGANKSASGALVSGTLTTTQASDLIALGFMADDGGNGLGGDNATINTSGFVSTQQASAIDGAFNVTWWGGIIDQIVASTQSGISCSINPNGISAYNSAISIMTSLKFAAAGALEAWLEVM